MLHSLYIKNFVLIDQLELEFHPKMSVFTGETGAGKSILLGALSLALGSRSDSQVVGPFAGDCEIIAQFDIQQNRAAQQWLAENEWPVEDHELTLRRQINGQGRSKLWINGRPVPAGQVRELGQSLVQIHGQHDQIKLLKPNHQQAIVDAHGDLRSNMEATATAHQSYAETLDQLKALSAAGSLSAEQKQLLQYQYDELEQLALAQDEYEQLHNTLTAATHAQDLIEITAAALDNLQDGQINAAHLLSQSMQQLEQAKGMDFSGITAMLDEALININEAYTELAAQQSQIDNDPATLQQTEQRLDAIGAVSRKQKVMPELLFEHHQSLQSQLQDNADLSSRQDQLNQQAESQLADYRKQALVLSQARQKAADTLANQITAVIQDLGLPDARLRIDVAHDPEKNPQKDGTDRIEFMITTNKGQPFQPLNKTASGGELSRISLAIEVCAQQQNPSAQSFVFDEVDTGIGGATAEKVGAIMQQLSQRNQVFAVTHLPQVAGHAHDHLLISKSSHGEHTTSKVTHLSEQQRIEELARMTGGETITETTLAQAKEFLKTTSH